VGARYELFLRMPAGSAPLDEAALEAALRAAAAAHLPLAHEVFRAEGVARGVDLGADPAQPGAVASLCETSFACARALGLVVYDPQLGRTVCDSDSGEIEEQAARGGAFAEGAAISSASAVPSAARALSASARLWLIVAAVAIGVVLLMRLLR
jgi:hypothetical protein